MFTSLYVVSFLLHISNTTIALKNLSLSCCNIAPLCKGYWILSSHSVVFIHHKFSGLGIQNNEPRNTTNLILWNQNFDSIIQNQIKNDMKHSSIEPHLRNLDRLVYDNCDDIKNEKKSPYITTTYGNHKCAIILRK